MQKFGVAIRVILKVTLVQNRFFDVTGKGLDDDRTFSATLESLQKLHLVDYRTSFDNQLDLSLPFQNFFYYLGVEK